MAQYKVPQDVEADDKLIGPFSFRQFIYLIAAVLAGAIAWGLYQLFPLLALIPVPVVLFFGALALPLKKDQPMEMYLAAMVAYYIKPHRRLWDADGIDSMIEITVPKKVVVQRTKNISQNEAKERFGYLAEIVDSQGWAVRGQGGIENPNSAMNADVYYAAQQAEDILDSSYSVAQSLDYMMVKSDNQRRQAIMERVRQTASAPPTSAEEPATTVEQPAVAEPVAVSEPVPAPNSAAYNFFASQTSTGDLSSNDPYPSNMHQKIIQPLHTTTSGNLTSTGIMNLVNDTDLSIQTIAGVASRMSQKDNTGDGVVIPLR
jgi:hypothetical protein